MLKFLLIPVFAAFASGITVLQYDDGIATWFSFDGMYRGVSFDLADFDPDASGFSLGYVEYWFFDPGLPPWDTAQFTAEVWSGPISGPQELIYSDLVVAVHFSPVYLEIGVPLVTGTDFWCIVNTEFSSYGSPSLLGDVEPDAGRSFHADEVSAWTPWDKGDYMVRAAGDFAYSMNAGTWASIKNLF